MTSSSSWHKQLFPPLGVLQPVSNGNNTGLQVIADSAENEGTVRRAIKVEQVTLQAKSK
jgi:hypothetical protein